MKMKSLTSHRYGGKRMQAGDSFEATRRDARVLTAVGYAKVEHDAPVAVPVPAPVPAPESVVVPVPEVEASAEEAPKRRRRKTEETPETPEPPAAESAPEQAEPSPRLRRFFERRDMQAEDTKE